ncbi:hypothetical protein ACEQPO_13340 [Bacillus sp. SL00103]
MWVKARGSIQNDTFVRDLVMIANDVNEMKPQLKEDTAPEGEKRVGELHFAFPNEPNGCCYWHRAGGTSKKMGT